MLRYANYLIILFININENLDLREKLQNDYGNASKLPKLPTSQRQMLQDNNLSIQCGGSCRGFIVWIFTPIGGFSQVGFGLEQGYDNQCAQIVVLIG